MLDELTDRVADIDPRLMMLVSDLEDKRMQVRRVVESTRTCLESISIYEEEINDELFRSLFVRIDLDKRSPR